MKKASFLLLSLILSMVALAQDAKIDVNVNKGQSNWYTNPIVWIIGAAVFILLLVALTRGRSRD
ncbi:MAG: hypothetical protein JWP27_1973 [Flaviaesturariibacter sp.]|nr:hypothetical protein [Flaviaesturariibacter sp.]